MGGIVCMPQPIDFTNEEFGRTSPDTDGFIVSRDHHIYVGTKLNFSRPARTFTMAWRAWPLPRDISMIFSIAYLLGKNKLLIYKTPKIFIFSSR
jgi:hypothetical protein